jgi:hypothetical protein
MRYSDSIFFLQWLSHFTYSDSLIFKLCQSFLRFYHALQWLSHFCYSGSVFFFISSAIFEILSTRYSDLAICYSTSVVLRFHQSIFVILSPILRFRREVQWLGHFATVTRWFHHATLQPFFYLSVILEIWLAIFLISSNILEISLSHLYHLQPAV